jgi:hypothetical protein
MCRASRGEYPYLTILIYVEKDTDYRTLLFGTVADRDQMNYLNSGLETPAVPGFSRMAA